ncbi:MAG: 5'/3'-nucleotidase SurE [Hyphomicrobiales bacterium]|nr:MAG: 5'/3'-nucleotidase SurE [Hyphomicrobiales bacterium]
MSLRILITNDDGVDAPGIAVMEEIARTISDDVWVVAPAGNQSGASHRFTFGQELELVERRSRVFAIAGGSPADCVVAGMTFVLAGKPADLVLSGVNNGQNVGDIVNCSGTAAGAREGAMQGAIGIAMSQGIDYENGGALDWSVSRRFAAQVIDGIRAQAVRGAWYNVNFPYCRPEQVSGVRVVPTQRFDTSPMKYYPSDNPGKFFIAIPETPSPFDPANDFFQLLHGNAITVTPVSLQASDIALAARMDGTISLR